jgi:hypothetical protein
MRKRMKAIYDSRSLDVHSLGRPQEAADQLGHRKRLAASQERRTHV